MKAVVFGMVIALGLSSPSMRKKNVQPAKGMTNEKVVSILLQEIADVRLELKSDINAVRMALGSDIAGLKIDIADLRSEVRRNHLQFQDYAVRTDRRLDKLETKVG